jgi:L-lactate dehydrogenase
MDAKDKVVIIGAGLVGSTSAYTLMVKGTAREIVLIDIDKERVEGEVMDLNHGQFFAPFADISGGTYEDCADASVVVIAAGVKQKPGQSRLDLAKANAEICRKVIASIKEYSEETIIIVVTNPVDILTYVAQKESGFSPAKVIGSGTVLDSARFRFFISSRRRINPGNVHAYVVGEHGDSEVPLWSRANIGGIPLDDYCGICEEQCGDREKETIAGLVKESAYHVIEYKGATYYAISLALERIIRAILRDENAVLTVSSVITDCYGISDVALSLPSIINRDGIAKVLATSIADEEAQALRKSAGVLKDILEDVRK